MTNKPLEQRQRRMTTKKQSQELEKDVGAFGRAMAFLQVAPPVAMYGSHFVDAGLFAMNARYSVRMLCHLLTVTLERPVTNCLYSFLFYLTVSHNLIALSPSLPKSKLKLWMIS